MISLWDDQKVSAFCMMFFSFLLCGANVLVFPLAWIQRKRLVLNGRGLFIFSSSLVALTPSALVSLLLLLGMLHG
jgi:hypothetical protein